MKHTKGKWRVTRSGNKHFDLCIIAEDGGSICHVTNWSESKANAKLISKAPEMLEALKNIKDMNWNITAENVNNILSILKEIAE